jgi:hypothetical protein
MITSRRWRDDSCGSANSRLAFSGVIGDIAPGASGSMQLKGASGNYHCTNHPSMVGSINGAMAPTPPPGSGGGY